MIFKEVAGIEEASKDDVKEAAKSNMSGIQRLMANLAEIFSPFNSCYHYRGG